MGYEKSSEDEIESGAFLDDGMGELDFEEDKESVTDDNTLTDEASSEGSAHLLATKAKLQSKNLFSLQARRAIEEHDEQRRLRKELDYLFDEDFVNEGKENSGKSS